MVLGFGLEIVFGRVALECKGNEERGPRGGGALMMRIDADFFEKGTRIPQGGARMERIIADFLKKEHGSRGAGRR